MQIDIEELMRNNPLNNDFFPTKGLGAFFEKRNSKYVHESYAAILDEDVEVSEADIRFWGSYYGELVATQDIPIPDRLGPAIIYEREIVSDLSQMQFKRLIDFRSIPDHMTVRTTMKEGLFWQVIDFIRFNEDSRDLDTVIAEIIALAGYESGVIFFYNSIKEKLFALDHPNHAVYENGRLNQEKSILCRVNLILQGKMVYQKALKRPGSVTPGEDLDFLPLQFFEDLRKFLEETTSDLYFVGLPEAGSNLLAWGSEYPEPYVRYPDYPTNSGADTSPSNYRSGLFRVGHTSKTFKTGYTTHGGARFYLQHEGGFSEIVVAVIILGLTFTEQKVREFGQKLAVQRGMKFVDFIELYDSRCSNYLDKFFFFESRTKFAFDSIPENIAKDLANFPERSTSGIYETGIEDVFEDSEILFSNILGTRYSSFNDIFTDSNTVAKISVTSSNTLQKTDFEYSYRLVAGAATIIENHVEAHKDKVAKLAEFALDSVSIGVTPVVLFSQDMAISSSLTGWDVFAELNSKTVDPYPVSVLFWRLSDDRFWAVFDSLDMFSGDLSEFSARLQDLSEEELIGFQTTLFMKLYLLDSRGNSSSMGGIISADGSLMFRLALVSSGRDTFEKAVSDPGSVVEEDIPEYYLAEEVLQVVLNALEDLGLEDSGFVDVFGYETGTNLRLWRSEKQLPARYMNYPGSYDGDLLVTGLTARFYLLGDGFIREVIVGLIGSLLSLGDVESSVRDFAASLAASHDAEFVDYVGISAMKQDPALNTILFDSTLREPFTWEKDSI